MTTMLARDAQVHQAEMVSRFAQGGIAFGIETEALRRFLEGQFGPVEAARMAQAALFGELQRQETLWAFVNNFRALSLLCLFRDGGGLLPEARPPPTAE